MNLIPPDTHGRVLRACLSQDTRSAEFEWRVDASGVSRGSWRKSPIFRFGHSEWSLNTASSGGRPGVVLVREEDGPAVRYKLEMRTALGDREEVADGELEVNDEGSPAWPLPAWEGREDELAPAGTLLIRVTMRTGPETVATQTDVDCRHLHSLADDNLSLGECGEKTSCLPSDQDSLSLALSAVLEDNVFPDVYLKCGDRKIAAHRAILAGRSEVFSAMFQSKMAECETSVVDITDVDVQVLELFLKYVYSGRLCEISDDVLPGLYAAGDKYAVGALQRACSERIIRTLTQDNYLKFLLLADAHCDLELKNAILRFILNDPEILENEEWVTFSKENLALSNEVLQRIVKRMRLS